MLYIQLSVFKLYPIYSDALKSVKHFIIECNDLMNVWNEVFKHGIRRSIFHMREVFTCIQTPWLRFGHFFTK